MGMHSAFRFKRHVCGLFGIYDEADVTVLFIDEEEEAYIKMVFSLSRK